MTRFFTTQKQGCTFPEHTPGKREIRKNISDDFNLKRCLPQGKALLKSGLGDEPRSVLDELRVCLPTNKYENREQKWQSGTQRA